MKRILSLISVLVLLLVVVGCGSKNTIDDDVIIVAASETPHAEILEQARAYVESKGYKLEIRVFLDYVVPNNVTQSGEVDANFFQHEPYLIDFNEKNKTNLVSVLKVHFEPLGLYQGKRKSLDDLEGAKIGIANDPSNGSRGLLLLEEAGIIELDPSKGTNVGVKDITKNEHNVQIFEIEAASIPIQLPDLDFAVINGNYALSSKIEKSTLLASESKSSAGALKYANILTVKVGNEEKEAIKVLIEALKQASVSEFITNTYDELVIPIN